MLKARNHDSSPEHRAAMRHLAKVGGMTSVQVRRILRTLARGALVPFMKRDAARLRRQSGQVVRACRYG